MKKDRRLITTILMLCMVVSLFPISSLAEVNIDINGSSFPDGGFRDYVRSTVDENKDGKISEAEASSVVMLDLSGDNISSLTGIEHFPELTTLLVSGNQLKKLDLRSNTKLINVDCSGNLLETLEINNSRLLTSLNCSDNKLTTLSVSNCAALSTLNCSNNLIDELDISENTKLSKLDCSNNALIRLDIKSNTALKRLDCSGNKMFMLDVSADSTITEFLGNQQAEAEATEYQGGFALFMREIVTDTKKITSKDEKCEYSKETGVAYFDSLPNSWTYTYATNKKDITLQVQVNFKNVFTINASAGENGSISSSGEKEYKLGERATYTFTPDNGYTVGEVYVDGEKVSLCSSYEFKNINSNHTISVNFIPSTTGIAINEQNFPDKVFRAYVSASFDKDGSSYLSEGEIELVKTVDISAYVFVKSIKGIEYFTELETLNFSSTLVSAVDLSQNLKLKTLSCASTKLEELDLSNNRELESVTCTGGLLTKIKSLNVYNCEKLKYLYCVLNSISTLDLSDCTALEKLYCTSNQLSELDVSNNKELTELECASNRLTYLDVSGNQKLVSLKCGLNNISELNVSGCKKLVVLHCEQCQLTNLEIYNCTELEEVNCSTNKLTYIVFDRAKNLKILKCDQNQLGVLNVSNLEKLEELSCASNTITSLDVTQNTALKKLNCGDNCLTEINLDYNPSLSNPTLGEQNVQGTLDKLNGKWRFDVSQLVSDISRVEPKKKTDEIVEYSSRTGELLLDENPGSWTYVWKTGKDLLGFERNMNVKITFTNTFSVTASAGTNGKIAPAGTFDLEYGGNKSFLFSPNEGYHVSKVLIDGKTDAAAAASGMYTMSNIRDDHTIRVEFEKNTYTVTATAGEGGAITPEGVSAAIYDDTIIYTVTADKGSYIKDIKLDGISVDKFTSSSTTYTYPLRSIHKNHTISAEFVTLSVEIEAKKSFGGTITPEGKTAVSYGGELTYDIVPNSGYTILDVLVDGVSIGKTASYTFENVTSAHTIEASFGKTFIDVPTNKYYYEAVLWAAKNSITSGTDESGTKFSPDNVCSRGEVVTFLWRAMGTPKATITECPFTDTRTNIYYYKAMMWAYENDITRGTSATTFSPADKVSRGQFVTFLWRAMGQPESTIENPFTDISPKAYYYKAVLWAYENGITTGTGGTTFSPNKICTRAEVVTFLYRALKK